MTANYGLKSRHARTAIKEVVSPAMLDAHDSLQRVTRYRLHEQVRLAVHDGLPKLYVIAALRAVLTDIEGI